MLSKALVLRVTVGGGAENRAHLAGGTIYVHLEFSP
jgi:hypothetical protein